MNDNNTFLSFPHNFLWGTATCPTQVEGEVVNEWAGYIADDGNAPDNTANHWRRYRADFRLMASLNLRAYRLGFDWARLQSAPLAELNREERLRYLEMLAELRGYKIEPFLTLFHHAAPRWFAELGGWLNPQSPEIFADFAEKLAILTDGEVQNWLTINEPLQYAFLSYMLGVFPPFQRLQYRHYQVALSNLRRAHHLAYRAIRRHCPYAKIGITTAYKPIAPARHWHPLDRANAYLLSRFFAQNKMANFLSVDGEKFADFIGVNYSGIARTYNLRTLSPLFVKPHLLTKYQADCDDYWEQNADGLQRGLTEMANYNLPIYLTGHAIATENERLRTRLLKEHLTICHQAIENGVDLRGYFYWSLLDNFEWSKGLRSLSGLIAIDFRDPDRHRDLRRTACIYGEIAKSNGFSTTLS